MENELITIQKRGEKQIVSARELYKQLGYNTAHWAKWYKKNILKNYFAVENQDWVELTLSVRKRDFALSIDFAKRLSMLARTEQGERIRKYFVACEQKLKTSSIEAYSEVLREQQAEIHGLKQAVKAIEEQNPSKSGMFTIKGYAGLKRQFIDVNTASSLGRKAKRICKKEGLPHSKMPDPRFGYVGLYPIDVLKRVFVDVVAF